MNLNNDQKAAIYESLIFRYQRLQEEVRQIKAKNFEISDNDQKKINEIENSMKMIYNQAQRLF